MGLSILSLISNKPGIKVPEMYEIINKTDSTISADKIKYSIKTELKGVIELRGSKKTDGHHLAD